MKKLVYIAAIAFAASMVACGNSEKAQEEATNEEVAPVEEVQAVAEEVVDSVAPDSVAEAAVEVVEAAQ